MSNRARSDAEKAEKGGYIDPRTTEQARATRALEKIHAFPTFREIPKPAVPLGEAGQREYDEWARILFDAGRLTKLTKQWIESLAHAEDAIFRLAAEGKPVTASLLNQRNRALLALDGINVDPSLTPHKPEENRFARNGFAARNRAAANHNRG